MRFTIIGARVFEPFDDPLSIGGDLAVYDLVEIDYFEDGQGWRAEVLALDGAARGFWVSGFDSEEALLAWLARAGLREPRRSRILQNLLDRRS
jgi:hypothetical protein